MTASRTKRTIQNSKISFLLFLIQIFIGFYSRKVFLDCLGDEVIGLNTTLGNILSFLNLAELGIGIAMATSLYKPLYENNHKEVCDILNVQGILYKRVAWILIFLSIPVLIGLPYIFPATNCSIIYVYIAFIVFLSGSLFSYFWNYRQILIQADQKNYKLLPWIHTVRYSKIIIQIFILIYTGWGLWGWIFMELVGNIATVFVINHIIHKEYPWLKKSEESASVLLNKYKDLLTKTKQMFVHKIGSFVLEQTSPLIIYAFVSLSMVTYYGNYMIIIGYVVTFMNVIFEGMGASIGNLVAENNKQHTLEVFWELFTSRIWVSGIVCFALYISIEPFICLWIGDKYLLEETTLLLLITGMYIRITRSVIDSFKLAYQLFADVWAPIVEASINLGCSILFGYWWGLNGVILGSNLSLILIILIWKPYYTFTRGLKASWVSYYLQYFYHTCTIIICAICTVKLTKLIYHQYDNYIQLVIFLSIAILIFSMLSYSIFYFTTSGMKRFTNRIRNIIQKKI